MALSINYLSRYLSVDCPIGYVIFDSVETEEIHLPIPLNRPTCLVVLCYVIKLISNMDHGGILLSDTIWHLNNLAEEYHELEPMKWFDLQPQIQKEQEITKMFVSSFMPEVQKFFKIPTLQQLSENDKSRKQNEILAGFIDFILQIFDSEALTDWDGEKRYASLQKELRFVLTFLGDIPFQCIELEEVESILAEFEVVANEAGCFISSCVFTIDRVEAGEFYRSRDSLLKKVGLLNEKIKEHCIKFSELPRCITPRKNVDDHSLLIVDSLLEDLENVINCRLGGSPIGDIIDLIKAIHEELMFAQAFLKDIEGVHNTHEDELKQSSIQIRDVAYEAEYLVNSYVVGNIPIWYVNLRLPAVIQKIKLVVMRLQEIKSINRNLSFQAMVTRNLSFQAMETPAEVDVDDNAVVGFEDETIKILDDLTGGSKGRQTISIFGLPGLGKTTMAKKLYNHRSSYDYFDERAWCVVSQTYKKKNVLLRIFMSLATNKSERIDKEEIRKMEDESLGLKIHKRLKGRRYLIVMDDVWDSNTWGYFSIYFPDDANGSRIILTSRIKDTAPVGSIFHPLHLLSEVHCWDLLKKKVFFREPCPPHLLGIAKAIAAKCRGLPLAVVVIAGILEKLVKEESVWRKVDRNLDSYIFDKSSGCLDILELSYESLPNHLKQCFLYFGAFREYAEIHVRKLIWLWIAEGFIPKQGQKSPENIAEEYLSGLINRSLVMIVERRFDGGIKICSIHDLLHDMCLKKAHKENFLKSIKDEFSIYEKHQRLCVLPNSFKSFGLYCRSFLGPLSYAVPGLVYMACHSKPSPGFSHMPLLRVIDLLSSEHIFYVLNEIYRLVNLRYLSIHELPHPTVLENLVNLETLCIANNADLKLSSILKMVNLRHLRTQCVLSLEKDCDTFQTTNLKSLGRLSIDNHDDEEILRRSPFLLKLKCIVGIFPDLRSLPQLESLNMRYSCCIHVELTKIYFPTTIKKLTLIEMCLPWEVLSIIGRLPNLLYLSLVSVHYAGEEWVTKDGEFQELRFLILQYCDVKQWITWSEHFPKLECLALRSCEELQEIPSDLGNISTLHTIEVSDSSYEASISAVGIEKEQFDYENEELKVIINNSNWTKEQLMKESCGEVPTSPMFL